MYQHQPNQPSQVVIFSKNRRKEILWEIHEDLAHHGVWATEQQIVTRYFWPGMREQIKYHIQSCHICQLRSTKKMHIPITISHPETPFYKVYLDMMNMPLAQGKRWLVTCRDDMTGITECKAIAHGTAKTIVRFFLKNIILRYGLVAEVVANKRHCNQNKYIVTRYS